MEFDNPVNTLHCDVLYLSKRFLQSNNVSKCEIYLQSRLTSYMNITMLLLKCCLQQNVNLVEYIPAV